MNDNLADSRWSPAQRYPDPAIVTLDERFAKYRIFNAAIERLYTGTRWAEGPVWFGDGRYLLWSDIPNNRVLKWDESTQTVSEFRKPSNYANGHARDRQGRLVSCEHGSRSITRTEYDGSITTLASHYQNKRLNSPNDIVVKSDGTIWFSDPPFGLLSHYEGKVATQEIATTNLYRFDPSSGALTLMSDSISRPNGLAFSPDEKTLYVVVSGAVPRQILAFDVDAQGNLSKERIFITAEAGGAPDGFRVDTDGNLWCGWGTGQGQDGVRIFAPDGVAIGHIHLPERCANLCFGGSAKNRLFMASSQSLYALYVNAQGVV